MAFRSPRRRISESSLVAFGRRAADNDTITRLAEGQEQVKWAVIAIGSPSPATDMSAAYGPSPVDTSPAEPPPPDGVPAEHGPVRSKPGAELPERILASNPNHFWF
jgi:hypothetical protein